MRLGRTGVIQPNITYRGMSCQAPVFYSSGQGFHFKLAARDKPLKKKPRHHVSGCSSVVIVTCNAVVALL